MEKGRRLAGRRPVDLDHGSNMSMSLGGRPQRLTGCYPARKASCSGTVNNTTAGVRRRADFHSFSTVLKRKAGIVSHAGTGRWRRHQLYGEPVTQHVIMRLVNCIPASMAIETDRPNFGFGFVFGAENCQNDTFGTFFSAVNG